jgi:hypothetical protein
LTPAGWIVLVVSVGTVTVLFAWCIWKVLRTPGETDHLHGFEFPPPPLESNAEAPPPSSFSRPPSPGDS